MVQGEKLVIRKLVVAGIVSAEKSYLDCLNVMKEVYKRGREYGQYIHTYITSLISLVFDAALLHPSISPSLSTFLSLPPLLTAYFPPLPSLYTAVFYPSFSYSSSHSLPQFYRKPLLARTTTSQVILSERDINTIFYRTEDLADLHTALHEKLEPQLRDWSIHTCVGDFFVDLVRERENVREGGERERDRGSEREERERVWEGERERVKGRECE